MHNLHDLVQILQGVNQLVAPLLRQTPCGFLGDSGFRVSWTPVLKNISIKYTTALILELQNLSPNVHNDVKNDVKRTKELTLAYSWSLVAPVLESKRKRDLRQSLYQTKSVRKQYKVCAVVIEAGSGVESV